MQVELLNQPGNTAAKITLRPGEICTAESGAMLAMSSNIQITTTTHKKQSGSFFKAAKRLLSGESLFLNHFETRENTGEVWLGTGLAGDMLVTQLDKENLIVQGGSFLASEQGIDIDMGWQGFKSLLSGENIFWLKLSGSGTAVLSSFGAIYPIEVNGDYIVDTGHIVAFNETLNFSITKAGKSWIQSIFGGEGMVCKFSGRGTVWCQSHNAKSFGSLLGPKLKVRSAR
jgi:uncharacterized protein (TIGR00266 family)